VLCSVQAKENRPDREVTLSREAETKKNSVRMRFRRILRFLGKLRRKPSQFSCGSFVFGTITVSIRFGHVQRETYDDNRSTRATCGVRGSADGALSLAIWGDERAKLRRAKYDDLLSTFEGYDYYY